MSDEIIRHYTERQDEEQRLSTQLGPFEWERTTGIIERYLSRTPLVVVDVGGGTGAYALWLAERGHVVHFIDIVPHHVERMIEKAKERSLTFGSIQQGDALKLPLKENFADLILLMGPLYHLTNTEDRIQALRECARVAKKGARVFCMAISRFASLMAGFRLQRFDDPEFESMVDEDLRTGQHRNPVEGSKHLGTAFLHTPMELRSEIDKSGLYCEKVLGIEGPIGLLKDVENWVQMKENMNRLLMKYTQEIEEEESLLGASFHLLGIAVRP